MTRTGARRCKAATAAEDHPQGGNDSSGDSESRRLEVLMEAKLAVGCGGLAHQRQWLKKYRSRTAVGGDLKTGGANRQRGGHGSLMERTSQGNSTVVAQDRGQWGRAAAEATLGQQQRSKAERRLNSCSRAVAHRRRRSSPRTARDSRAARRWRRGPRKRLDATFRGRGPWKQKRPAMWQLGCERRGDGG